MAEYLLVTLIQGRAKKYHTDLRRRIVTRFNVPFSIRRKVPSHITLKYHFNLKDTDELEDVLSSFSRTHKKAPYRLKGFGSFRKDVIFMEVVPSRQMRALHTSLIKELKKIKGLAWSRQYEKNFHFHASLAYNDLTEKKYAAIQDFLKKYRPDFKLYFDNIVLLRLQNGVWKIHKKFMIQKN